MPPDVYTAQDIAAAARVPDRLVTSLLARGEIRSVAAFAAGGQAISPSFYDYVPHDEAVRAVRALAAGIRDGLLRGTGGRYRGAAGRPRHVRLRPGGRLLLRRRRRPLLQLTVRRDGLRIRRRKHQLGRLAHLNAVADVVFAEIADRRVADQR